MAPPLHCQYAKIMSKWVSLDRLQICALMYYDKKKSPNRIEGLVVRMQVEAFQVL